MQHQHQKPLDIILCLPCRVPLGLRRPFSGLEVEVGAAAHILTRTLPAIIHFPLPRHHFFWKRNPNQLYSGADKSSFLVEWYAIKLVRDVLMKFFLSHFHKCFWPIKGVYFLQNAYNLNFKLFFRL